MNILIVAHHFPPENSVASLRPYSWAKYWSKLGHNVCVLTTEKSDLFNAPLTSSLNTNSFDVEEVSYLPKRKEEKADLNNSGKSVSIENTKFNKAQALRFLVSKCIQFREVIGLGALLSVRLLWIKPAIEKALTRHKEAPFDLVVSTYGPPFSHIISGIIKRKIGTLHWVADYRDLWNDYNFETKRWPFSLIENYFETYFVSRADTLSTVSEPLADILRNRFRKPVIPIENGFDLSDLDLQKSNFFPKDGKIRLAYTGTIYPKKRSPLPLLNAIKKLVREGIASEYNLEVLFYSNKVGNLPQLIHDLELEDIVKILGFVDRASSLSIQCSADALIFIDWSDDSIDGILTGKIFEYIYARTPILGIGSDETRAAGRLIRESGTGFCLGNSSEKIADVISKLLNGETLEYSPRLHVLSKYTREGLAHKMLNTVIEHIHQTK